jgi:pimeloyl-ACP methyl ester carboxylesterase
MRRSFLALFVLGALSGAGVMATASCSSSSNGGGSGSGSGGSDATTDAPVVTGVGVEVPCTDSADDVYADPGDVSARPKGAILKCHADPDVSAAELLAAVQADAGLLPYAGRPFTSGAHVYRVLYRTERGDANKSPGYSSARVLLPDTPRAAAAATRLPVLVASHASVGQAGPCAPSRNDPAGAYAEAGFWQLVYPLVGLGYAVIAPDLAGYSNYGGASNPPSAYAEVEDVGKSTLDGARALRNLIPSIASQQIVLVGHSQGGQTTLSALAIAESYGADGIIAAAAVYSPLWWSQRTSVALFLDPSSDSFAKSSRGPVSIWTHYTSGELLDGPGHGVDVFAKDKQAVVKQFVDHDCWSASYPLLEDAGASANDIFDPSYVSTMGAAAELGACPAGNTTCQKWLDRLTADYPHLTGGALKVPLLVWYANHDTTIPPDLAACMFERLSSDKTNLTACYDPNPVGHSGVVATQSQYVADWIAAQTLPDAAAPAPCATLPEDDAGVPRVPDDAGAFVACNPLVPKQ